MIHIGGYLLLGVFLTLVGFLLLIAAAHIYHAVRFGGRDPLAIFMTVLFVAGFITIIMTSLTLFSQVPWSRGFDVNLPEIHFGAPT